MKQSLKKILTPRKLWVLRLYTALLTFLAEFLLILYVAFSLYNILSQNSVLGDLVVGYAGLYVVWGCIAILFVAQVVSLFLNIHDNVEDMRNKLIDQNFSIDIDSEREKIKGSSIASLVTIASIVLAIVLSFINLNRDNNEKNSKTSSPLSTENLNILMDDPALLPLEVFKNITDEESRSLSHLRLVFSDSRDLDGDDVFEKIKIYDTGERALIVINDQLTAKVDLLMRYDILNNSEVCDVKAIDIDKTDNSKEFYLELTEIAEDPPVVGYVIRFTNGVATITRLLFDQDDHYNSRVNYNGPLVLEYAKRLEGGYVNGEVKIQDFSITYEPYTIGLKIKSKENGDVYFRGDAACPFVYHLVGQDFVFKGEIIRNLVGKNSEKLQYLELGLIKKGTHKIRVWEKKDEVSFINYLYLTDNGLTIPISVVQNSSCFNSILSDDYNYYKLNKGEYFDLVFYLDRDVENLKLFAKGYYIPNSKPV